jgi:hypothetical protein
MIRSQPAIPERVPVLTFPTPRGKVDLVFFERRDSRLPKNQSWCYGDEHPNKREYPDHELVLVSPDDGDPAWQRWYYAAVREKQHLYNWTATDEPDWPALTQVFFVKRCSLPVDEDSLLPPPVEFVDTTDYLVTGTEIGRAGDDLLESLYVTVKLTREHLLNNPKVSYVLDAQTNTLRPVVEEKIPASQAEDESSPVNANGQYSEVRAATSRWAIKTTQFMEGLAGGVAGGGHVQEWTDVLNYSWPYVFRDCSFNVFPSITGGIAKLTVTPRWLRERYDGPCEATIREEWTLTEPTPPVLQPMLTTGMEFNGGLLQVGIPPCLHPFWYFFDSAGTDHPDFGYYSYYEEYPATTLQDWPEEHIASFTVRPAMGGYISRTVTVKRPANGAVFANILTLLPPAIGAAAGSMDLTWSHENVVGTLIKYRLSVNKKADFSGAYLSGFNKKNVGSATSYVVTGLLPGTYYFAKVEAYMTIDDEEQVISSNTQMLMTPSVVSYTTTADGTSFSDGDTLDFGAFPVGSLSPFTKTISITNTGNIEISGASVSLSSSGTLSWTATALSTATIAPGGSATFDLEYSPATSGVYEATMVLGFSNAPEATISLTGTAGDPEATITYNSSPISSGDTVSFDDSTTSGGLDIENTGEGSLFITGYTVPAPWEASAGPFFDPIIIPPGVTHTLDILFSPTAAGSFSETFSMSLNTPSSPFTLNLDGTASIAELQFEQPSGAAQPSGFTISFAASAYEGSVGAVLSSTFFVRALAGAVPLTVSTAITGPGASRYALVEVSGTAESGEFEGGEYLEYRVDYTANSPGSYDFATIEFTHNDPSQTSPAPVYLEASVSLY